MKKKFFNIFLVAGALGLMQSCDTDFEIKDPVDLTQVTRTPEYYENLRNYKKTDHEVAFGWFGNWTGGGASLENSLMGLPDSVDFVSLWSDFYNLDEAKKNDLKQVKTLKGTKALGCIIVMDCGDRITPPMSKEDEEKYQSLPENQRWRAYRHDFWGWGESRESKEAATIKYANAICDSLDKYDIDGFDIDAEPNYAQPFATDKEMWNEPGIMQLFLETLGKRIGPMSGTDKMLVVDGEPYMMPETHGRYFDYFILQAYACNKYSNLDGRNERLIRHFCKNDTEEVDYLDPSEVSKKVIVCENFESYADGGGVYHTTRDGKVVPSLIGMSLWEPVSNGVQYRKGGVGTFHMEYEYNPGSYMSYPALRKSIQIMNPSVK